MSHKKTILICPLDWGLGHATRCVPLIKQFIDDGHKVIIGADKNPLAFLKLEFPFIKTICIPGYDINYGTKGSKIKLLVESIRFYNFIKKENSFIDKILEENKIDLLISDNRYGLWSKKVKSILITHQLYIKAPIFQRIAHQKIKKLVSNFDECWIPDFAGNINLSGNLSHLKPIKLKHKFIGPLSRFTLTNKPDYRTTEYDLIAIISGPEPQRTIFENLVLTEIKTHKLKSLVVRGLPNKSSIPKNLNSSIKIFNHIKTEELKEYVLKSKIVLCRSGYTSIMDLVALQKKAILVPTPGQTEQEYLATYHSEKGNFYCQKQVQLNLKKALSIANKLEPNLNLKSTLSLPNY